MDFDVNSRLRTMVNVALDELLGVGFIFFNRNKSKNSSTSRPASSGNSVMCRVLRSVREMMPLDN